jgi:hypothetical protein
MISRELVKHIRGALSNRRIGGMRWDRPFVYVSANRQMPAGAHEQTRRRQTRATNASATVHTNRGAITKLANQWSQK